MGNLQVDLGLVQYDSDTLLSPVPLAAQIGLAAGAAVIILSVLVVILMYRYCVLPAHYRSNSQNCDHPH